jgi:hypothetical protein
MFIGEIEKIQVRGVTEWLALQAETILVHVKPLIKNA